MIFADVCSLVNSQPRIHLCEPHFSKKPPAIPADPASAVYLVPVGKELTLTGSPGPPTFQHSINDRGSCESGALASEPLPDLIFHAEILRTTLLRTR